jgi:hypothetical protein
LLQWGKLALIASRTQLHLTLSRRLAYWTKVLLWSSWIVEGSRKLRSDVELTLLKGTTE